MSSSQRLVAGLRGSPLPCSEVRRVELGVAGREWPDEAARLLLQLLAESPAPRCGDVALAASAALLTTARARGPWGIAALGAGQIAAVLLAAPSLPWISFVLGTWALCAVLAIKTRS